jgi:hypothetical protein
MRLRTGLILVLGYLALPLVSSLGWGRPWLRILAAGLLTGVFLIQLSERRLREGDEHVTLNLHN